MPEKIKKTIEVEKKHYYGDEVPIEEFLDTVTDAKDKGATTVTIESEYESGSVDMTFSYDYYWVVHCKVGDEGSNVR
jgi:hypothetical protein